MSRVSAFLTAWVVLATTTQAFALSPQLTASSDTVKIFVATGESLRWLTAYPLASACEPNTGDYYFYGQGVENTWSNFLLSEIAGGFSCRIKAGARGAMAGLAGRNVSLLISSEEGVSGAVIQGLGRNPGRPQLRFLTPSAAACVSTPVPAGYIPQWRCSDLSWQRPMFGVSEVSPDLVSGLNVYGIDNPADGGQDNKLHGRADAMQRIYGIAVNPALYRAMQAAQGLPQDNAAAHRPSIARAVAASYFTGSLSAGPMGLGWQYLVGGDHALAQSQVNVCRSRNGSGVQALLYKEFLGYPCSLTALAAVDESFTDAAQPGLAGIGTSATIHVVEGAGENAMEQCLGTAQSAGAFAIGLLSIGRIETDLDSKVWTHRFVKLDGVAPDAASAKLGMGLLADVSVRWDEAFVATLPGAVRTLINGYGALLGSADILGATFGNSARLGVLAIADNKGNQYRSGSAASVAYTGATWQTHSCQPRSVVAGWPGNQPAINVNSIGNDSAQALPLNPVTPQQVMPHAPERTLPIR